MSTGCDDLLTHAFHEVLQRLENVSRQAGRPVPRLLAVSKTQPAAAIDALAAAGQRAFGENYVQEAAPKQLALASLALEWHLIGHLQSNKAKDAAERFDWVQSVDRAKLVDALARHRPANTQPLNVLIQVNIDDESSKQGCAPEAVDALARQIASAPRLTLRGLMAIPAPHADLDRRRLAFTRMNALFESLAAHHPQVDTLSMGMSDDLDLAIAEGATMVRVGTALFGARGERVRVIYRDDPHEIESAERQMTPTPLQNVAFIGGGNMARSLIGGLIARGTPAQSIRVAEPVSELREALARDFGVATFADGGEAVAGAETWVLAVKPQVMRTVCESLEAAAQATRPLVVSIAAGITASQLERWLGGDLPVVRAMPNTPALLGAGVSGLHANDRVDAAGRARAQALLDAAGRTVWIDDEVRMDAVTAVSGSGPAYVFLLAEAMQAAGEAEGLTPDAARALALQTILGAARMLTEGEDAPAELRQRVTSPGGTTQAAIETFEAGGFGELVARAIHAATERGRALSAAND